MEITVTAVISIAIAISIGFFIRRWARRLSRTTGETKQLLAEKFEQIAQAVKQLDERFAKQAVGLSQPREGAIDVIGQQRRMERLQNDLDFIKNRLSSYLGDGAGLTYLVDETPIYINTNDFGCPANFLNGGRYEEEYFQVLTSFRRPDSVFLDIGANLGVFSLRLAPFLRYGHIYAFEPNRLIHELFSRSIHLNGLKNQIELLNIGASDQTGELVLSVPEGHAGGASVVLVGSNPGDQRIMVRRIDDVLRELPAFHIAKIDVEGHELNVLRGMIELLGRSPDAVLVFEKLVGNAGLEADLMEILSNLGLKIYRIDGVTLRAVDLAEFVASEAYFLAARHETVNHELDRNFLTIYPRDLFAINCTQINGVMVGSGSQPANSVIFHGPYWYLPKGSYRLKITGKVAGSIRLVLAEKFGYPVAEFEVNEDKCSFDFVVDRDLSKFEIVGRSNGAIFEFEVQNFRLTRLG